MNRLWNCFRLGWNRSGKKSGHPSWRRQKSPATGVDAPVPAASGRKKRLRFGWRLPLATRLVAPAPIILVQSARHFRTAAGGGGPSGGGGGRGGRKRGGGGGGGGGRGGEISTSSHRGQWRGCGRRNRHPHRFVPIQHISLITIR